MRKTITVVAALCLFAAVPSLADFPAGTVNVTKTVGYHPSGAGGEYTISNTLLNTSAYASVATVGPDSFQTFCIERFERESNPAQVTVSTTFIDEATGLVTGPGTHAIKGRKTFGDNLEAPTAFLYTMFATGQLGTMNLGGFNYNYTPGAGRAASAQSLQFAIWHIEEDPLGLPANAVAAAWKAAAEAAVAEGTWTGIGSVRVMNMYTPAGADAQDMLYFVPVPGAVLLGFLGLGVAGLKLRKLA